MKPTSDARTCGDGCMYLRERLYEGAFFRKRLLERMQCFASEMGLFLPRIIRMERISPVVTSVIRQKPQKPLAVDARCLLRAIDAVPI